MATPGGGASSAPPPVIPEPWSQRKNYVSQPMDETTRLLEELESAKKFVERDIWKPKCNMPSSFSGKPGAVQSWVAHMDAYVSALSSHEALAIATTYLEGEAFSLWTSYNTDNDVASGSDLSEALQLRLNPLNQVQAARDLLHKCVLTPRRVDVQQDVPVDRYGHPRAHDGRKGGLLQPCAQVIYLGGALHKEVLLSRDSFGRRPQC